jgi:hypothetical protein
MATHEIFERMEAVWNEFSQAHASYVSKNFKKSAVTSRKHALELRKLATEYKKQSGMETRKV